MIKIKLRFNRAAKNTIAKGKYIHWVNLSLHQCTESVMGLVT